MHFSIYYVFYSPCSDQNVLADITTIFRLMLLVQEYKRTSVVSCVTITP